MPSLRSRRGKNPVMVAAGKKAWKTRQKKLAKAQNKGKDPVRVAAAKKAWKTIRNKKKANESMTFEGKKVKVTIEVM